MRRYFCLCSKFLTSFSYSKINHSRTTEFYYENGTLEVLHSFAYVLTLIKSKSLSLKIKMCFCESKKLEVYVLYICGHYMHIETDFKDLAKMNVNYFSRTNWLLVRQNILKQSVPYINFYFKINFLKLTLLWHNLVSYNAPNINFVL